MSKQPLVRVSLRFWSLSIRRCLCAVLASRSLGFSRSRSDDGIGVGLRWLFCIEEFFGFLEKSFGYGVIGIAAGNGEVFEFFTLRAVEAGWHFDLNADELVASAAAV